MKFRTIFLGKLFLNIIYLDKTGNVYQFDPMTYLRTNYILHYVTFFIVFFENKNKSIINKKVVTHSGNKILKINDHGEHFNYFLNFKCWWSEGL